MNDALIQLIKLIDHHLLNAMVETDSPAAIVDRVLEDYASDLRRQGLIPKAFEEDAFEELRELARDAIRIRTYGCLNIADYRKQKRPLG